MCLGTAGACPEKDGGGLDMVPLLLNLKIGQGAEIQRKGQDAPARGKCLTSKRNGFVEDLQPPWAPAPQSEVSLRLSGTEKAEAVGGGAFGEVPSGQHGTRKGVLSGSDPRHTELHLCGHMRTVVS